MEYEQQAAEQQAQQNDQSTGADPGKKADTDRTFTQAEVDAIVKERVGREQRKADEASKKAAAEAEAKALSEQGKYKELYEATAQERDELKPYRDRYEALASQQRAALMAEVAKWPAEVKALLPGEDADVTVLAEAVTKARALVTALNGKAEGAAAHGNPPPPAGKAGMGAEREADRKLSAVHFYRDL